MANYVGNTKATKIFVGDTQIKNKYVGSVKVWDVGLPKRIWYYGDIRNPNSWGNLIGFKDWIPKGIFDVRGTCNLTGIKFNVYNNVGDTVTSSLPFTLRNFNTNVAGEPSFNQQSVPSNIAITIEIFPAGTL